MVPKKKFRAAVHIATAAWGVDKLAGSGKDQVMRVPADRDIVESAASEARYYPQPERQLSPWQKRSPSMSATATERQRPKVPGMSAYSD
jgi:hypothetical protein